MMVESFKQTACQLLLGRFGAKGKFCELNLGVCEFGGEGRDLALALSEFNSQVADLVDQYDSLLIRVDNEVGQFLNARLGLCV